MHTALYNEPANSGLFIYHTSPQGSTTFICMESDGVKAPATHILISVCPVNPRKPSFKLTAPDFASLILTINCAERKKSRTILQFEGIHSICVVFGTARSLDGSGSESLMPSGIVNFASAHDWGDATFMLIESKGVPVPGSHSLISMAPGGVHSRPTSPDLTPLYSLIKCPER